MPDPLHVRAKLATPLSRPTTVVQASKQLDDHSSVPLLQQPSFAPIKATRVQPVHAHSCRFDFPGQWPSLLSALAGAAAWTSPLQPAAKLRALFALKNVLRALRSKRFVVEAPEAVAGLSQAGGWSQVPRCITEREEFYMPFDVPFCRGFKSRKRLVAAAPGAVAGRSQACALRHLPHQVLLQA